MFKVGGFYKKVSVGGGPGEDRIKSGEIVHVLAIASSELLGECWIVEDSDSVNFNPMTNNVNQSLWEESNKKDFNDYWNANAE